MRKVQVIMTNFVEEVGKNYTDLELYWITITTGYPLGLYENNQWQNYSFKKKQIKLQKRYMSIFRY